MQRDECFSVNLPALHRAIDLLACGDSSDAGDLPDSLPEHAWGEAETLRWLAPHVLGRAAILDASDALAHMDPPTPWITWALALWNARLNQNLLHPATAPFARVAEERVISWLAPFFGMSGGHMVPGSTLANITALWAARDVSGARRVVASQAAHLSIRKAAHILGLGFEAVPVNARQQLDPQAVGDLSDACLVLTAGTTAAGAIDPFEFAGRAAWTHVDAAWAGPLRLSERYRARLAGIEWADSVAVSAHKWLFQPKESALIFFRDAERANRAISFSGGYLSTPNIGVLGSHGAMAIMLMGTLMAWGLEGLADRIDRCMANAWRLYEGIDGDPRFRLLMRPETGVVVFRPTTTSVEALASVLVPATTSITQIDSAVWLRCVAANPVVDIEHLIDKIRREL